jgi:hypothetical protein
MAGGLFRRWLHWLWLPISWGVCSRLLFEAPGDEYGLWGVASWPGALLFLAHNRGDIRGQLWIVLAAGVGVIMVGCLLMAMRRIIFRQWLLCAGGIFVVLLIPALSLRDRSAGQIERGWIQSVMFSSTTALSTAWLTCVVLSLLSDRFRGLGASGESR